MASSRHELTHIDSNDAPRLIFRRRATLYVGDRYHHVRTADISQDGISLMTDAPLAPGSRASIALNIVLDGKMSAFTLDGVSVYCVLAGVAGFRVGFRLDPHTPALRKTMAQILGLHQLAV